MKESKISKYSKLSLIGIISLLENSFEFIVMPELISNILFNIPAIIMILLPLIGIYCAITGRVEDKKWNVWNITGLITSIIPLLYLIILAIGFHNFGG